MGTESPPGRGTEAVITGPTRNRLSWETGTVGSNPTLSASFSALVSSRGRDARVGLRGTTGNRVCAQKVYRGFESLSLRHNSCFEQGELSQALHVSMS